MEREKQKTEKVKKFVGRNKLNIVASSVAAVSIAAGAAAEKSGSFDPITGPIETANHLVLKNSPHDVYKQLVDKLPDAEVAEAVDMIVSPSNMGKWQITSDSLDYSYQFVTGPTGVPSGSGSLELINGTNGGTFTGVKNSNVGSELGDFYNTRLDQITNLSYSTYATEWGTTSHKLPILILEVDGGFGDSDRLIFDPNDNTGQAVPELNKWQNWNVKNGIFDAVLSGNQNISLHDYLLIFPNAVISSNGVQLGVGFGTGTESFDGNVDNLTFNGNTYNFEPGVTPTPTPTPVPGPTTKDQCKNDGWKLFSNPKFRNQGECILAVK
jgi:hypothetical protein